MTRPDLLSSPLYRWTYRTVLVLSVTAAAACAAFALAPGWLSASCSVAGSPSTVKAEPPVVAPAFAPHTETLMEKIERLNYRLDCAECALPTKEIVK